MSSILKKRNVESGKISYSIENDLRKILWRSIYIEQADRVKDMLQVQKQIGKARTQKLYWNLKIDI